LIESHFKSTLIQEERSGVPNDIHFFFVLLLLLLMLLYTKLNIPQNQQTEKTQAG